MSYFAQKKNRIIAIAEEKALEYSEMGYTVTDKNGDVICEATVTSVQDAKKKIEELNKELKEAKKYGENADAQIAQLKEENAELKEQLKNAKKSKGKATATATAYAE